MYIKVSGERIVFGPVRLSYTHILSRFKFDGDTGEGKYSTNILIPKGEKKLVEAVRGCIGEAVKNAKDKWGNRPGTPGKTDPLYDGTGRGDVYEGCYFLNAKSNQRPQVVDRNNNPIVDEEEVYSGMWAYVSVTFFPYSIGGNGIGCALGNVRKYKDDEKLGGGPSAVNDFGGISDEDDDL